MPGFDYESARRIGDVVRYVEAQPVFKQSGWSGAVPSSPNKLFTTTATITARSGATLGKGNAQMQTIAKNHTTGVATYDASPQDVMLIYNTATTSIASGLLVHCKLVDGLYVVDVVPCVT